MKTKLQRAEEKFKAEQHKADIRRLKKVDEHLGTALAELNMPFYEGGNADLKEDILTALEMPMENLARAIKGKEGETDDGSNK